MPHLSIVIPLYKCSTTIPALAQRLEKALPEISEDYEIIFINDGSPENDWEIVSQLAKENQKIKGINFSRNFGQHHALTAGLDFADGEWIVVMDGDLQDQPEEIKKLYNKAMEGYDIVLGKRSNRNDSVVKKLLSKWFYRLLSYLSNTEYDPSIGTFRILSAKVVRSFRQFNERLLFFGAMINWLGFKTGSIEILHEKRNNGKSTYSMRKRINLAINGILSFSDKPLHLSIKLGVSLSIIALLFIFYKVILNLALGTTALGWSSLIAAIGFSTGLIVTVIGVVGLYVGSIFKEVKQRPNYICSDLLNIDHKQE